MTTSYLSLLPVEGKATAPRRALAISQAAVLDNRLYKLLAPPPFLSMGRISSDGWSVSHACQQIFSAKRSSETTQKQMRGSWGISSCDRQNESSSYAQTLWAHATGGPGDFRSLQRHPDPHAHCPTTAAPVASPALGRTRQGICSLLPTFLLQGKRSHPPVSPLF